MIQVFRLEILVWLVSCLAFCSNSSCDSLQALIVVIQLRSAESRLDFDAAQEYLDVEQAYGACANDGQSAQQAWEELATGFVRLGEQKKFVNLDDYHKYDITVECEEKTVVVTFTPKQGGLILTYELKECQGQLEVFSFHGIRKDNASGVPSD